MFSEHIQLLMIFRIFINLVIVIVFFQEPNKYKWNVEKLNIIQASFFLQNLLGVFYILEKVYWDVVVQFVNIVHLCCTRLSGQRENEVFGVRKYWLRKHFFTFRLFHYGKDV